MPAKDHGSRRLSRTICRHISSSVTAASAGASRIAREGCAVALSGTVFLLLAASAANAEGPSGGKVSTTYAIAMHGQPALPADFSRLPYADPKASKGGRLALAYQGTFDSLNPYNLSAGSTAQGLIGNVFQSLMLRSLDEPFTLYGLVAQSIETDEAHSYVVFRLDPRARFSDGVPVSAADVLFTFDLLRQKGRPQLRDALARVERAEALDLMTVRFDLGGLDGEMPLTLAMMPVLPKHDTDVERFADPTLKPPVGTGPYVIADVRPGERLTLRRNPNYWAQDLPVQRGLFNFDEIEIDYYRDADSSFEAFKAGLCDFRQETDAGRWMSSYDFPAMRDGRIVKESLPYGVPKGMEGFAFNTRRPIFADIRVREALGMMFDFEWINANIYGGLYRRSRSYFDDQSSHRPVALRMPASARCWRPFPARCATTSSKDAGNRPSPTVRGGTGRGRSARWRSLAKPATPSRTVFSSSGRAADRSPSRSWCRAAHRSGFRGSMRTASSASASTRPSASPMRCSTSAAARNSISTC